MHGATHLTWGLCAGAIVAGQSAHDWIGVAAGAAVGGLAALLPDWLQVNVPGVKQVQGVFGHRGFSHWVWTPVALAIVGRSIAPAGLVAAFLAGWLSHILLDTLSNGVPALWPFGRVTLAHVKTGGKLDRFIGGAGLVFLGVFAWTRLI